MKTIVCVKQIPNPETPPANFKIDMEAKRAVPPPGEQGLVINPFDEQAVEAALKIKDTNGGNVTVLTLGPPSAKNVLKHAMAMGADEGILLDIPDVEDHDSYSTALILSKAIKKIGEYDIILCGRQAGDWDNGQVGLGIAELLDIPSITPVKKIEVLNGKTQVERVIPDGYEVFELKHPFLASVSSEIGLPRYTSLPGILAAAKKEVVVWSSQELELESEQADILTPRTKLLKLFIPVQGTECIFMEGEDLDEKSLNLALKLKENKLI